MDIQEKSYSPQEIESLIQLIDTCILEANQTINSLHKQLSEVKDENLQLKDKLNQYEDNQEEMQLMVMEKDEQIKKLQGLLEMKNQQNQLKVNNGNINSNRNDDLSHFLKIIDSLNTENKQLRQQIELLQYENQKAIQLACNAKNNKLYREINSKLDLQSPNNSNIENNVAAMNINDTFTNKLKSNLQNINSSNSNSNNNLNINNLSYIHHNNNSFNNSTNEILKKFNLSDSTNLTNPSATIMNNQQISNNTSTNLASTKKNYKYLKPKK
ncbi:hypothetical protein ABPG74_019044 [Tetrahymena malaccensis]